MAVDKQEETIASVVFCLCREGSKASNELAYIHVALCARGKRRSPVSIKLFIQSECNVVRCVCVCTCAVDTGHNASSRSVSRDSSRDFSYQEVAYYRLSANLKKITYTLTLKCDLV